MKRRSFLKGLLAAPVVAKAVATETEPKFEHKAYSRRVAIGDPNRPVEIDPRGTHLEGSPCMTCDHDFVQGEIAMMDIGAISTVQCQRCNLTHRVQYSTAQVKSGKIRPVEIHIPLRDGTISIHRARYNV